MPETAPPQRKSNAPLAIRALAMTTVFLTLWAVIALSLRYFDRYIALALPSWAEIPGLVLMVLGFAAGMSSVFTFIFVGRGTPAPIDPPKEFVAVGPYRYVRNPMYVGGWVLLFGLGLFTGSMSILLFSFLWVGVVHVLVLKLEEPGMRKKFGQSYEDYCRAVPRWIPRFGGR